MRKRSEGSISSWLIGSIFFLIVSIVGIFGYLVSKEMQKKKQVESEIDALKEESVRIEKENLALEERISYLGSKNYQEMQAKDKLNLQSPEESVVVVAEGPVKKEEAPNYLAPASFPRSPQKPNYIKWWNYFFE